MTAIPTTYNRAAYSMSFKNNWEPRESSNLFAYEPRCIEFEEYIFVLNEKLTTVITFEEQMFFIENELLDISVWGDTRDEAIEAFDFMFYSLYLNYYNEDNDNLTPNAILLKETMQSTIKRIINEN